eukprot:TRINITY_DN11087_c0_g1_i1.p1 TRINITY_DN11087_c0_g1~~TRINITY_DN11087_c0_g1_i1.p1  ORF type:complete len:381 (+),score=145.65 TRINITY_DN11087_c0_g1_i1:52-1194(+)
MPRPASWAGGRWSLWTIMFVAVAVVLMNVIMFGGGARRAAAARLVAPSTAGKDQVEARRVAEVESRHAVQAHEAQGFIDAKGREVDPHDEAAWRTHAGAVHWFTILNAPRYYWCETLASAWHNEITMNIWGWGNKDFDDWLATWMKIPLAVEFSEDLPDDAIMGFVDGADSLFQRRSEDILTEYEQLVGAKYNFAMSTEINCAVQSLPKHGCDNERFPMTPWGRRYLNSGLYMGKVGEIRRFLSFVYKHYLPLFKKGTVQANDQSVIGKAWHDGWSANFTLDTHTRLFQSVRMAEAHYCNSPPEDKKHPVPDPATKLLKNCLTGHAPGVMHFNGKAKPFLGEWLGYYWWHEKAIDPRAVVFVNKQPKHLKELCPKLNYAP